MKNSMLISNPSYSLRAAVTKRQHLRSDWVDLMLLQSHGARIYFWAGKRGPEIALRAQRSII